MPNQNAEQIARDKIDAQLQECGWAVQDRNAMNLAASCGVAVREFIMKPGHGTADYLLYVNRKAVGAVEAKKEGAPLTGVEIQTEKYAVGLPDAVPAIRRPLPILYQATARSPESSPTRGAPR